MNEFNCDSLKKLSVPEELIEKALSIPSTAEDRPAVIPWYRQGRAIAAAASVALVVAVGIAVYFFFGNMRPPVAPVGAPVRPTDPATLAISETVEPTDSIGDSTAEPTAETQSMTSSSVPPTQTVTNQQGEIITIITVRSTGASPEPSDNPASDPPPPATEKPSTKPEAKPLPTHRPTVPPTSVPSETVSVTEPVTQPLTQPMTEPQTTSETDPETEPENTSPTDAVLTFRTTIRAEDLPPSGLIYCRIFDRERRIVLGSADRYDASHRADYSISEGRMTIVYRPSEHGIDVPPGEYTFTFHDENGKMIYGTYITVR